MFDYSALSALSAVVREGSFERAAQVLNVTPSAVSQRIRALEERVGCALVERAQPCVATDAGRRLCLHVGQVMLLEQQLRKGMPQLLGGEVSRVAVPVAVNADSLATWFTGAVADYAAQSDALMEVVVDDEGHTADWLRNGKVMAAVTDSAEPPAGCKCVALGAMRYIAAASPTFVRQYFSRGLGAKSLAAAPSLAFNNKDTLQSHWVRRHCRRRVDIPRHLLPSTEAFITAAQAGMGWGMQPEVLVAPLIASGELVPLADNSYLDVPLYWQVARASTALLTELTTCVKGRASKSLLSS
ncbi:LysR family transcriptional regulator ArgP [Parahaliea mediterranea]|uniref:LysR family transcriptional regulator ArgP n=1 Tax=Parahaliea mediterranea TaxID=651086 RepID=UPI000E2EF170|nr:LysR family transcriptional regulator ArgP [Parahaliea mediterranea]